MLCGASAALNWSKPSHAQLSPKARNLWEPAAVLRSVLMIAEARRALPDEAPTERATGWV